MTCCLSPISLIFLISNTVRHIISSFFLVEHFGHQLHLFRLLWTQFFIELWSKQISDFSLKILTLPLKIHLKKSISTQKQYPTFDWFRTHTLFLHSPVLTGRGPGVNSAPRSSPFWAWRSALRPPVLSSALHAPAISKIAPRSNPFFAFSAPRSSLIFRIAPRSRIPPGPLPTILHKIKKGTN